MLAVVLAQHSSLQHEAIHGHPTRHPRLNEALVYPALGLLIPYRRFRDMHLAHHYDPLLTDPHDDPESNYLDPAVWARLRRPVRALLAVNNTLLGRMVIGPVIGMVVLWRDDLARDPGRRPRGAGCLDAPSRRDRAGGRVAGAGRVDAVVAVPRGAAGWRCRSCGSGPSSSIRRTSGPAARSVIIEDRGPLSILFLNNNYHAVHHANPRLPWYRLPEDYARRREEWLARNGGYVYRSYGEVMMRHLLRRKDPVAHPIWTPPEPGAPRGAHPVSGRPLRQ